MKTIAIAALVTAIGGSTALAQGAPPGSSSWQTSAWNSSGSNSVVAIQAQGMSATGTTAMNSGSRIAVAKKGAAVPLASGQSGHYRRG
jgi:hypothetical protein